MFKNKRSIWTFLLSTLMFLLMAGAAFAGEADINLPDLAQVTFMGGTLSGMTILNIGLFICLIGMAFGVMQYVQTKNLPAHKAMLDVSQTIWETCKTYLFQQGKFLIALWALIAICMIYYFGALQSKAVSD
ncbi:MAG: sodium-translocating pyrophosphatase, partial [Deltaproteobacteria bacterium]|nr:sodium-translocating pyrophosphatase [Deltaproteobacteria bacterium]